MTEKPRASSSPTWFLTLVSGAVAVVALSLGRGLLIPLAATALLFILWVALVDRIARVSVGGRSSPGWLTQILAGVVILGAAFLFGALLSSASGDLADALPKYQERLSLLADRLEGIVGPGATDALRASFSAIDPGALIAGVAADLAGAIFVAGLIVLYLGFLMSERHLWVKKILTIAGTEEARARAKRVLGRISDSVKEYMWVNAATSALSAVVAYVIFSLVGLDFAKLLALIVFVVGFIPNIGAFIGIVLPSLVAFLQFDSLWPLAAVLVGYGLCDQFIANVITPSMQGRSLNLSTFMIMVSLAFWSIIWGGIGAFLAVPLMVVMMIVMAEFPQTRWMAVMLSSDGDLKSSGGE